MNPAGVRPAPPHSDPVCGLMRTYMYRYMYPEALASKHFAHRGKRCHSYPCCRQAGGFGLFFLSLKKPTRAS